MARGAAESALGALRASTVRREVGSVLSTKSFQSHNEYYVAGSSMPHPASPQATARASLQEAVDLLHCDGELLLGLLDLHLAVARLGVDEGVGVAVLVRQL